MPTQNTLSGGKRNRKEEKHPSTNNRLGVKSGGSSGELSFWAHISRFDRTGMAEVVDRSAEASRKGKFQFVCLNFADPDMVGHTGIWRRRSRQLIKLFVLR